MTRTLDIARLTWKAAIVVGKALIVVLMIVLSVAQHLHLVACGDMPSCSGSL